MGGEERHVGGQFRAGRHCKPIQGTDEGLVIGEKNRISWFIGEKQNSIVGKARTVWGVNRVAVLQLVFLQEALNNNGSPRLLKWKKPECRGE
jgi:hypothetical protein